MYHHGRAWALIFLIYTINVWIHSVINWSCFNHRIVWIVCCLWLVSFLVTCIGFRCYISFGGLISFFQSYLIHFLSQTGNFLSMLYFQFFNLKLVIPFKFWNSFILSFQRKFEIFYFELSLGYFLYEILISVSRIGQFCP